MDIQTIIDGINLAFKSFGSSTPATMFAVFGLILLIVAAILAYFGIKSDKKLPTWYSPAFFLCLGPAIVFAMVGPGLSILESHKSIARVDTRTAFQYLKTNEKVDWLMRLVAFDPDSQPELEMKKLTHLGLPRQKFTFVLDYQELRGVPVDEAVRLSGASVPWSRHHVTGIIWPRRTRIYPANARGLLQVINEVEKKEEEHLEKPFNLSGELNPSERNDLKDETLHSWDWDRYKVHFNHYCNLTIKFRKKQYSEQDHFGMIGRDWNPLGFSSRDTTVDMADPSICTVSDWEQAMKKYESIFGARIFFADNLEIAAIQGRYLIDFDDPAKQIIPDIWNDRLH